MESITPVEAQSLRQWRELSFPLNVYAALLELEQGQVEYLHYGLFEHAQEAIDRAQERASQRLWAQLPEEPCRVLEVGIGLGTTLARLLQRGCTALGITPDAAQISQARQRHGRELPVRCLRLEDLPLGEPAFDLMLLQESAQYIDPLALFQAACRNLVPEGAQMVLMDEFALRRDAGNDNTLHLLGDFIALARRFGWLVEHEEDLSNSAAITVTVLQRLCHQFAGRVQAALGVEPVQWQALQEGLGSYAQAYADGRFGYRLLRLRRQRRPVVHMRVADVGNHADMRRLFADVFKQPMTEATWRWKYRPDFSPSKSHGMALADANGQMQAHYAGFRRDLRVQGQPMLGCQVGDVMVAPQAEGSLSHHRVLQQLTATFLERQIGWGRPHSIGFGFPNARAMAVAQRLGLYEPVDKVLQVRWPAAADVLPRWHNQELPADGTPWTPGLQQELAGLWQQMAAALSSSVLCVRDAAWLHWRYAQRPDVRYGLTLVRSRKMRRAVGLLVTRANADALELLDVVAAPRRFALLVAAARAQAAAAGLPFVRGWITASHLHLLAHGAHDGLLVDDPQITVPANCHTAGPAASLVRDRWFLMSGDADFT